MARILEEMGLAVCGTHGTTAALALLNDAVKKGGVMASSQVGGLSGAFIPVSEDAGMIDAVKAGALSIEKLEAMTAVCSVGLDMIAIPGDTPEAVICGIIADEISHGGACDPRLRQESGRHGGIRRTARLCADHEVERLYLRGLYRTGRQNSRTHPFAEELIGSEKTRDVSKSKAGMAERYGVGNELFCHLFGRD